MSALTTTRSTPRLAIFGVALAAVSIGAKASEVIPDGVIAAVDTSGRLVNATASRSLRVIGRVNKGGTGTAVDRATKIEVEPGCFGWDNSASADAIAAADIGKPCYVVDNHTVALTDAAGTRPYAGVIVAIEGSQVFVAMLGFYDSTQASKNEAGGAGSPLVQGGTGTLVAGVLTVSAGVQITASSVIVASIRTPGGTFSDGNLSIPSADRVVGEPGTGSFTIRALVQAGTANVGDTSTVDYVIFG